MSDQVFPPPPSPPPSPPIPSQVLSGVMTPPDSAMVSVFTPLIILVVWRAAVRTSHSDYHGNAIRGSSATCGTFVWYSCFCLYSGLCCPFGGLLPFPFALLGPCWGWSGLIFYTFLRPGIFFYQQISLLATFSFFISLVLSSCCNSAACLNSSLPSSRCREPSPFFRRDCEHICIYFIITFSLLVLWCVEFH